MPVTLVIDATVGGAAANAFVTEAEQIAYMAARLNASTWTTVAGVSCTETEKAAIIESTREVSYKQFLGTRATSTQSLSWPRWFVLDPDAPTWGYVYFAQTVVPQRVKDATMELAFQFVKAGTTDIAALDPLYTIKRKKIDVLETEYDSNRRPVGLRRYPRVWERLAPLLATGATGVTTIMRG